MGLDHFDISLYYIRKSRMSNNNSNLSPVAIQPWERNWVPADSWDNQPGIDEDFLTGVGGARASDFGFTEPMHGIGKLKAFAEVPFLLLLGRPGAGKSQEMQAAFDHGWLGSPSVLIRGKEIGSESPGSMIQEEIEATVPSPEELRNLRILIDGLDEVLLQNPSFIPQLTKWMRLQKDPAGRLLYRLAISCRWADWPEAPIKELAALWTDADAKKLVLCPLSQTDAAKTLQGRYAEDVADRFWKQMRKHHLQPVACWPQGFKNLMEGYESKECLDLPHSLGDATAEQIQRHCMLTDTPDDPIRWTASVHGAEWRQRVAGRVAAAMIWSGKPSLVLEVASSQVKGTSLSLADLIHTDERWEEGRRGITLEDLYDLVHRTGLLKRMSDKTRWIFQSQVYQEWLAADWLTAQQLPEAKLSSLFGSLGENGWRVFPALRSVAAWLARMDSTFRSLLLKEDPLVLLRLDAASLPAKDRKDIVEAILKATQRARVVDSSITQSHLHSLVHERLDIQLRRWLEDKNVHTAAKEMAAEMAEKTRLTSLVPFLWELYPTTSGRLQIRIANALYDLARDGAYDDKWKAVLARQIPNDEHATMLGAALEILVTKGQRVPVREVLDWVLPRIRFSVMGLYDIVVGGLHEHMTVEDLPAIFAHLSKEPRNFHNHDSQDTTKAFNDKALRMAFQHFDRSDVAAALISYWYACIKQHVHPHHALNSSWTPEAIGLANDARRKEIIRVLIHHPDFEKNSQRKWVWGGEYLFIESDFEWCLDEILAASSNEEEWRYALVARHYLKRADLSGSLGKKFEQAWSKSEFLRQLLPPLHEGTRILETLVAEAATQQHKNEEEFSKEKKRQEKQDAFFKERVRKRMLQCRERHEKGDTVWPGVLRVLVARQHGDGQHMVTFGLEDQVGEGEDWMRDAAGRYLTERPLRENLDYDDGLSALFALAVRPGDLSHPGAVHDAVAAHWLPPLLEVMGSSHLEKESAGLSRQNLAALFPESFAVAFGKMMGQKYSNQGSMTELQGYQAYWNPAMTRELAKFLKTDPIQPSGFATALRYLFIASESSAMEVAEHWLAKFASIKDEAPRAALVGAATIMLRGRLTIQVKDYLLDPAFAIIALRNVIGSLDYIQTRMDFSGWPNMALQHLADIVWKAFPKMKIRHSSSGRILHGVSNNDLALEFRDHITTACRSRGLSVKIPIIDPDDTQEEAEERRRTVDWNLHATLQAQAGAAWQFITPATLFTLASRPHARLARNNEELMQAVMECLRRWEHSLDSGSWDHLWDVSTLTSRPEKRIAREMRDWLQRELNIMAECEVELVTAERTDILIKTTTKDTTIPPLTVVIELKRLRADNAGERRTAMKTQLLDRYLTQQHHEGWTHGLYVIAWTPKPFSDADTPEAIRQASTELEIQAAELSKPPFTLKSMVIDARFRDPTAVKADLKVKRKGNVKK